MTNISRRKGNQAMIFDQLIERNMRIFFYEKPYTKCDGDYSQTVFWKIKIEHISGSILYSFIQLVIMVCQVEDYQNILKLSCRPLAFTTFKAFFEKRSGTSPSVSFSAWFLKKNISVISHYLTKFHCLFAFTLWDIVQ